MRDLDFTSKMKHNETAYILDMFIQLSVISRHISCGHPPLKLGWLSHGAMTRVSLRFGTFGRSSR